MWGADSSFSGKGLPVKQVRRVQAESSGNPQGVSEGGEQGVEEGLGRPCGSGRHPGGGGLWEMAGGGLVPGHSEQESVQLAEVKEEACIGDATRNGGVGEHLLQGGGPPSGGAQPRAERKV